MKNKRKFEKTMIDNLAVKARDCSLIDPDYYNQYQVKRGLRDIDGKGVLVGLTEIGEVRANTVIDNEIVQIPGELYYRGIEITEIVNGFLKSNRFGFEETAYLLLFGDLPTKQELTAFCELLDDYRKLPDVFVRDMILNMPSRDIMNSISRSVLAIYSLDDKADDTSIENVLRQCLNMIACFPLIAIYGYQALTHYHGNNSLYIHSPLRGVGTAKTFCTCSGRTASIRSLKQGCSTLLLSCTPSTAEAITPPL